MPGDNVAAKISSRQIRSAGPFIRGSSKSREIERLFNQKVLPMMTISSRAAALAVASLFLTAPAFAQTTAPAAAPSAKAEKKMEKPRTAASLECSKEADAKSMHGKERKKFMSECKKAGKDAAAKPKS
jgi:hypothetical protein